MMAYKRYEAIPLEIAKVRTFTVSDGRSCRVGITITDAGGEATAIVNGGHARAIGAALFELAKEAGYG